MEKGFSFTQMLDESFEKIEKVYFSHNVQRISRMERKLEELERDLTGLIESVEVKGFTEDHCEKYRLPHLK